jgi:hypothetical protein
MGRSIVLWGSLFCEVLPQDEVTYFVLVLFGLFVIVLLLVCLELWRYRREPYLPAMSGDFSDRQPRSFLISLVRQLRNAFHW